MAYADQDLRDFFEGVTLCKDAVKAKRAIAAMVRMGLATQFLELSPQTLTVIVPTTAVMNPSR